MEIISNEESNYNPPKEFVYEDMELVWLMFLLLHQPSSSFLPSFLSFPPTFYVSFYFLYVSCLKWLIKEKARHGMVGTSGYEWER